MQPDKKSIQFSNLELKELGNRPSQCEAQSPRNITVMNNHQSGKHSRMNKGFFSYVHKQQGKKKKGNTHGNYSLPLVPLQSSSITNPSCKRRVENQKEREKKVTILHGSIARESGIRQTQQQQSNNKSECKKRTNTQERENSRERINDGVL